MKIRLTAKVNNPKGRILELLGPDDVQLLALEYDAPLETNTAPAKLLALATNWPLPDGIPGTTEVYPNDYLEKSRALDAVREALDAATIATHSKLNKPAREDAITGIFEPPSVECEPLTIQQRLGLLVTMGEHYRELQRQHYQIAEILDAAGVPATRDETYQDEDAGGNLVDYSETFRMTLAERVKAALGGFTPERLDAEKWRLAYESTINGVVPERSEVCVNVYPPDGNPLEVQRLTGPEGHVTINVTVCPQKDPR